MKNELKPDVIEMLNIGEGSGLIFLEEAYFNYMRHYDLFFNMEKYSEQYYEFMDKIKSYGFVEDSMLLDITISQALEIINEKHRTISE